VAAAVWPGLRRTWKAEQSAGAAGGLGNGYHAGHHHHHHHEHQQLQQQHLEQLRQQEQQREHGGKGGSSSRSEMWYKLLVVSGWGEGDSVYAAPVYQAAWSYWLRHKLTPATTSLTPEGEEGEAPRLVALAEEHAKDTTAVPAAAANAERGDRGWSLPPSPMTDVAAGAAARGGGGGSGVGGSQAGFSGVQHGRRVWRTSAGDVLCLKQQMVNSRGQLLGVEVQDICCSRLASAVSAPAGGSSSSRGVAGGGATASVQAAATAGAAGVLLLVAGVEGQELSGALARLQLVLEHMAGAVAVPLAVLAASGGAEG
jgi:hypothetical protein